MYEVNPKEAAAGKSTFEPYFGINFGMALDAPIYSDIISFSPEVTLLAKMNVKSELSHVSGEIQVPLLFTCYVHTYFGLELGPELRFRVTDMYKFGQTWDSNNEAFENVDFGISGGARYAISDNAFIVGRLYFGLRDILNVETNANRVFQRGAQISFLYAGAGR